jgi:phosphohistidine phosphatase SixA
MTGRWTAGLFAIAAVLGGCAAGTPATNSPSGPPANIRSEAPTTVFLVRHAEKASDAGDDPPLTEIGRRRADDLATTLRDAGVEVVVVSERRRTHETAAPLVRARGIAFDTVRLGSTVAEHAAAVARRIREAHRGRTVLVVGHSNTIPPIVAALGGPRFPDICDPVHSELFTMLIRETGSPQLVRSRYGASDTPPPGTCPGMPAR